MISQKLICTYQNCLVDYLSGWIDKLNFGENNETEDLKLLSMYQLYSALANYDFHPKKKVQVASVIVSESDILNFDCKSLNLYKTKCIEIDPEEANCLSPDEICQLREQLSILCENCNCDC
jgi:hypothetical protein